MTPRSAAALRLAARIALVVAVAFAAHRMMVWAEAQSDLHPGEGEVTLYLVLGLVYLSYAVLIAIPYVPGIEIGLTILMMQGPDAVLPVYLSTLFGLMLAFCAGYLLPPGWLRGILSDLGLARATAFLDRMMTLTPAERIEALRAALPGRLGRMTFGWRYLLLALVLNVPGNGLLGGGGGIMLVVGLSGLFRPWITLLTIALAVAPVPLMVWTWGNA